MFYRVEFLRNGKLDWTKIATHTRRPFREVKTKFKDLLEFLYTEDYGEKTSAEARASARNSALIVAITKM